MQRNELQQIYCRIPKKLITTVLMLPPFTAIFSTFFIGFIFDYQQIFFYKWTCGVSFPSIFLYFKNIALTYGARIDLCEHNSLIRLS